MNSSVGTSHSSHPLPNTMSAYAGAKGLETLRDGTQVFIRPIRKEDAELERAFLEHLSSEFQRHRFLGVVMQPSPEVIKQLTDIDPRQETAFIALTHQHGKDVEVGVGRYYLNEDRKSCECTVAVSPEWQKRGVGQILAQHLIDDARARGLKRMYSIDAVYDENVHMLAQRLGFERKPDREDPLSVTYELLLQE